MEGLHISSRANKKVIDFIDNFSTLFGQFQQEEMIRHKDDPDKLDKLYKESMKFKHEITTKLAKYDDEFMKAMGVNKNE